MDRAFESLRAKRSRGRKVGTREEGLGEQCFDDFA